MQGRGQGAREILRKMAPVEAINTKQLPETDIDVNHCLYEIYLKITFADLIFNSSETMIVVKPIYLQVFTVNYRNKSVACSGEIG